MLSWTSSTRIFLVAGATDMRKAFNGLAGIVLNELQRDLLSGELFVFANRRLDRVKVLFFDGTGLWVCAKRLEKGRFSWPETGDQVVKIRPEELTMILGGIDLGKTKQKRWYRRECAMREVARETQKIW